MKSAHFGYYKNSGTTGYEDQYISCSIIGCVNIAIDEYAVCNVNSIGQLIGSNDNPAICLDNTTLLNINMTENLYYLIHIDSGNTSPFKTSLAPSEKQAIILKSENESLLKVENPLDGYYLKDAHNQELIRSINGEFTEIVNENTNYYINAGDNHKQYPFIYCDGISECQFKEDTSENNGITCSLGNLFSSELNNLFICLSDKVEDKVDISNSDETYHLLLMDNTGKDKSYTSVLTGQVSIGEKKVQLLRIGNYKISVILSPDNTYYLNSGNDASFNPLIYCQTSSSCTTTTAENGDYFINGDDHKSLLYCQSNKQGNGIICSVKESSLKSTGSEFYLNAGEDKMNYQLIKCTYLEDNITCSKDDSPFQMMDTVYYLNSNEMKSTHPLIQCKFDSEESQQSICSVVSSDLTEESTKYYIHYDKNQINQQLIECSFSNSSGTNTISCTNRSSGLEKEGVEYYINGGEDKLTRPLIKCEWVQGDTATCSTVVSTLQSKGQEYYLNYGKDRNVNPLIQCQYTDDENVKDNENTICFTRNVTGNKVIYKNAAISTGLTNSLIECTSPSPQCQLKDGEVNKIYKNQDAVSLTNALINCDSIDCEFENGNENGCYLNGAETQIETLVDGDTLSGSCGPTTVGNLIKDQTGNYYLCIEDNDDSRVPFSSESTTKTTTFYSMILSKDGVFGANGNEILIKIKNQSAVLATTTFDTNTSHHIYVDHKTGHLSTSEKYNECPYRESVIRYTLSEDQTIIESLPCKVICFPASDEPYCDIGYYLVEKSEPFNTITEPNKQGTLYYCDSLTTCHEIPKPELRIGYLINMDFKNKNTLPYISCSLNPTTSLPNNNIICQTVAVTATNCSEVKIAGDLIVVEGENGIPSYKICLQGTSSNYGILLDPTVHTSTLYIFSLKNRSIFNLNQQQNMFIILDIKDGQVLPYSSPDKTIVLKYLFTNKNYQVLNKNEMLEIISANQGDTSICNELYEFEMIKEEGKSEALYKKNE